MAAGIDHHLVDIALVVVTNLFNLAVAGIMVSRVGNWKRLERSLGWFSNSLALPVAGGLILNTLGRREWWAMALPGLFLAFLIIELILDYILKLEFRRTRLLGPYLLLFYAAQMGMIGYAFLASEIYGAITLVTYFLCLGATGYSYSKVGHGRAQRPSGSQPALRP
jgi:hypothetical protein